MKRLHILLFLSALSASAFAADEKVKVGVPKELVSGLVGIPSVPQACESCVSQNYPGLVYSGNFYWNSNHSWDGYGSCHMNKPNGEHSGLGCGLVFQCLEGETLDRAQNACLSDKPRPNTCPAAGTVLIEMKEDDPGFNTNAAGLACYQGCAIKVPGATVCVDNPETGKQGCNTGGAGNVTYTGNQCTESEDSEVPPIPTDPNNPDPDPNNPGGGSGSGEEGGEGGGNGSGGDGEGNGEGSGGTGGGNGSGGSGSGDGDGKGEGEEGEDEQGDSKWSGNCAAGFTAEGDALAVAIAKAEWERNCTFIHNPKDSDEYKYYEANKGLNQGDGGALQGLPKETINLNQHLSDTNLLGGGQCLPDYNFTIFGRSIPLPISKYCDLFKWIGIVLQALAMIWGARIALGGL